MPKKGFCSLQGGIDSTLPPLHGDNGDWYILHFGKDNGTLRTELMVRTLINLPIPGTQSLPPDPSTVFTCSFNVHLQSSHLAKVLLHNRECCRQGTHCLGWKMDTHDGDFNALL